MSSNVMNFKRNFELISLKIHANNKQNLVRRSSTLIKILPRRHLFRFINKDIIQELTRVSARRDTQGIEEWMKHTTSVMHENLDECPIC